ncbi:MAG: hypothetical protein A2W25_09365 [candidate division Zixibacteria bacterium RBG_16_53_22]|nr:MAG: hypothetical protein A2W25_09365 [candidate division Zixibacteria bacterium RBG_16_53_22]
MIRRLFIILLLFVLYEGFYFLPKKLVEIFPGAFRLADALFIILPLFSIFFARNMFRAVSRFREESLLVLGICGLMFLSPLMAEQFFGQSYTKGLLFVRHNLGWLAFFPFAIMLRDLDGVERTIRVLTILAGIYVVILLLTKYFPDMGLIHYDKRAYSITGSLIRFGEYRLFFPYGSVPILFYCITMARFLHPPQGGGSLLRRAFDLAFILVVAYAILSTFTRALIFSVLIATAFGLFSSRRRFLKYVAVFVVFMVVSMQAMVMASSEGGVPFIEDTKLWKMILKTSTLPREADREEQISMYLTHFPKSPLTGVGNLVTRKDTEWEIGKLTTYRKYGFYNATDIGYLKIAAENGLLGIAWVIWFLSYFYRRSRQTLSRAVKRGDGSTAEFVARGHLYFLIYLSISGLTLPHFVYEDGVIILALSLAIMAVTRTSSNEQDVGTPPCNPARSSGGR